MRSKLVFLGLGVMGSPMAINLLQSNYTVVGWNRTPNRPLVQKAAQAGVQVLPTIAEAVKDADFIFICVSDVEDVKAVIFGEGGIAENAKSNALIVDFSTIGTTAARDISAQLQPRNLRFMDAPVSGGDIGAQKGTLTIMVGGDKADFDQCLPLLQTMGKKIIHCGAVGNGQAVKLCNQVLCAVHMVALCEAMQVAEQLDIDPNLMIEVCSSGAAGSWALSNLGGKIAESDFAPGFMIKHILKDLRLVQESLADTDINLPGVKLSDRLFKIVQNIGGAEQGTQAMIRAYKESNM
ncbi:MAG TPA: NAD(P)-dependent oxidoreductase [Candidatus Sericytochromatia bacterium]